MNCGADGPERFETPLREHGAGRSVVVARSRKSQGNHPDENAVARKKTPFEGPTIS